ncbi:DUF192 domain-containing protein [Cupriavidus sp. UYPR2.512]|uniref:DUF192 domain-containing protein n=1 Tax=Cupriavidus sp. UYPR2.512 TaxID=1080187 RepID=UPI0003654A5C|nr:DUF192 domain-containing protein [Cupriavidus sp. UYPR2.512]UIF87027.1 DUF192 domain-containing protein [Cupriavidus necator]
MRQARLYLRASHGTLDTGVRVSVAATTRERMAGLLSRESMAPDEALLLSPCGAVHTFGMRMSIDVVFLDKRQRVLAVHPCVGRQRVRAHWRARQTLELGAGRAAALGIAPGQTLEMREEGP